MKRFLALIALALTGCATAPQIPAPEPNWGALIQTKARLLQQQAAAEAPAEAPHRRSVAPRASIAGEMPGGAFVVHNGAGWRYFPSLSAALEASGLTNATVYLPPGFHPLSETIVAGHNFNLVGAGVGAFNCVLWMTNPANDVIRVAGNSVNIRGLAVSRESQWVWETTGNGIVLNSGIFNTRIEQCDITRHAVGILKADLGKNYGTYINDTNIIHTKTAVRLVDHDSITGRDNWIFSYRDNAVELEGCAGAILRGWSVFGGGGNCFVIRSAANGTRSENIQMSQFVLDATGKSGLVIENAGRVKFSDGWIASAGSRVAINDRWEAWPVLWGQGIAPAPGAVVTNSDAVIFTGSEILVNGGHGIVYRDSTNGMVASSLVHTNGITTFNQPSHAGIVFEGANAGMLVGGVRSYNEALFGFRSQGFGIRIEGRMTNSNLGGNNFSDPWLVKGIEGAGVNVRAGGNVQ